MLKRVLLAALCVGLTNMVGAQEYEQVNTTSPQTLENKTLVGPVMSNPTITGTISGTPTIPTPSISNPIITGTVGGGASYTTPTITNPTVTGTVSGTPTIPGPTISNPTITGTVAGGATYSGITAASPVLTTPSFSKFAEASLPAPALEGKLIWLDDGPQGLIGDFGSKLAHLFGYNWTGDSYATLEAAVAALGSTQGTIIFAKDITLSTNTSVPCTAHLWRQGKGRIVSSGTPVLTMCDAGHMLAPMEAQIFDFSSGGSVTFTSGGTVYPNWWGTDGTNDEVQIQQAINSLPTQGPSKVYSPSPNYSIGATISIVGKQFIEFEGNLGTRWTSAIVGAAANPMISLTGSCYYVTFNRMYFAGNMLTGASGNGHAVYIDGAGASPFLQFIKFIDVTIVGFKGTGKDRLGVALDAAGIYATEAHSLLISHSSIGRNQYGVYLDGDTATDTTRVFKTRITDGSDFDTNLKNGLYAKMVEGLTVDGETLFNQSGQGNAGEGNISVTKGIKVTFKDIRLKDGDPWEMTTNSNEIETLVLNASYIQHYVNNAAVRVDSSCYGCEVSGNRFQWVVPDVTSAKGIQVDQGQAFRQSGSLRLVGNRMRSSNNLTIDKCIDVNVSTNNVLAMVIESNICGEPEGAGGGGSDVVTTGISLAGAAVQRATVRNNTIGFFAGGSTTTCISLGANVKWAILENNHCVGTVTNELTNGGSENIVINNGRFQFRDGITFANLPSATPAGQILFCSNCNGTNPCTGAGTGTPAISRNGQWDCLW